MSRPLALVCAMLSGVGLLASTLIFIAVGSGPALAVKASPPTCYPSYRRCIKCIECEDDGSGGCRCVKCGIDRVCMAKKRRGGVPAEMKPLLDAHNAYRDQHCAPPMTWSKAAAASAQEWANQCNFSHPGGHGYGENLAWGTSMSPARAAQMWYDEVGAYDWNNPGFSQATGHFTQVVWQSTTQIGCGMAQCGNRTFIVCRYAPPGNYEGQFPQNVLQRCK